MIIGELSNRKSDVIVLYDLPLELAVVHIGIDYDKFIVVTDQSIRDQIAILGGGHTIQVQVFSSKGFENIKDRLKYSLIISTEENPLNGSYIFSSNILEYPLIKVAKSNFIYRIPDEDSDKPHRMVGTVTEEGILKHSKTESDFDLNAYLTPFSRQWHFKIPQYLEQLSLQQERFVNEKFEENEIS